MVTIVLDERYNLPRHKLIELLKAENIDSRPFFYPLSSIPAYAKNPLAKIAIARNKFSYQVSATGINLPSGMDMTKEKVCYVCDILKSVLTKLLEQ